MSMTSKVKPQVQIKVYVDAELVTWLEYEETNRERSRSYMVNEALQVRKKSLERRRKGFRDGQIGQEGLASVEAKGFNRKA